jgi:hypothetical protein
VDVVEALGEEQVGELLDYGERVEAAALPDGVDLTADGSGEHRSPDFDFATAP